MHILFLHNSTSGKGISDKKINFIVDRLKKLDSNLVFIIPKTTEEFKKLCVESCGKYDYLLISGGDGSINIAINMIAEKENMPILGFFPTGTCNDICKNYGINSNINKCIKIIEEGHVEEFDILKCNDDYCVFAMALGGLSKIPYETTKADKRKIGKIAYYLKGMSKMFEPSKVSGKAIFKNGEVLEFTVPFIIVLNTSHVGSYNVNPKSNVQDGKFDLYLNPIKRQIPAMASYIFHSKKIPHYLVDEVYLEVDSKEKWDIDGECGKEGNMNIKVIKSGIKVLCNKNLKERGIK